MLGVKFKTKLDPNSALGKHLEKIKGKPINVIEGAYGGMDDCVGIVEEITRPAEGGIFTKFVGCSYLYKGYPEGDTVERLDISKDISWLFFRFFNTWVGRMIIGALIVLPKRIMKKFVIRWAKEYFHIAHTVLRRGMLQSREFCPAIRELRRALDALYQEIPEQEEGIRFIARKFISIVAMLLENDAAYKFRFQDIVPEFDIEALQKNPVKELKRVFAVLYERETTRVMRVKWGKIERVLMFFLRISGTARKILVRFFIELDLDKIKLDETDWYFCLKRGMYNYRGVPLENRISKKKRIDEEKGHDIPRIRMIQQGKFKYLEVE